MRTAWAAALAAACLAPVAHARAQTSGPPPARVLYAQVAKSCAADVRRFCPGLGASSPRNQAICLKPYKSDLGSGCRRAVKSVFP